MVTLLLLSTGLDLFPTLADVVTLLQLKPTGCIVFKAGTTATATAKTCQQRTVVPAWVPLLCSSAPWLGERPEVGSQHRKMFFHFGAGSSPPPSPTGLIHLSSAPPVHPLPFPPHTPLASSLLSLASPRELDSVTKEVECLWRESSQCPHLSVGSSACAHSEDAAAAGPQPPRSRQPTPALRLGIYDQ